jgi:5'-3' exonuclease
MQYLIDASVYIYRAYYSIPDDMVDDEGNPINALYGFCRFLGDFMEKIQPAHIAVLFDEGLTSSFRADIYPEYKANRDPAPLHLKRQFVKCQQFTKLLGLFELSLPKFEADDLIGTLVKLGRYEGRPSTIVTRDKDLAQLITEKDIFWDFSGKGRLTYQQIPDVFGVKPEQIADFLALAGDSTDNIPGVPGIGKKTATALLQNFQSLDDIYSNLEKIKDLSVRGAKTLASKLEQHESAAILARKLTGIHCDAPIDPIQKDLSPQYPDLDAINTFYDEVNIGTALRRQAERISELY